MATVFSMIINGDIPGTFVWRDEVCVGFMSINPLAPGHTLVVPIEEVDHWLDASPELQAHLFEVSRHIGDAQQAAFSPERVGLMIAGFEVPHLHVHVIPTRGMADMDFANAAASVDPDELQRTAQLIRDELTAAGASGLSG
ncbi:MAG: HIT family protein [Actinomycetota bacterium]|jgi:histidine triad (HIT) family protein|nr:HIT family protein [Actinomycetota bacterium]